MLIIRKDSPTFTYASERKLEIGTIVTIQAGKKTVTGVIMAAVKKPDYNTKPVLSIIEERPLPLPLVKLAEWISAYYATHLSSVLQLMVPRGIQKKRRAQKDSLVQSVRNRTKIVFNKYQLSAIKKIKDPTPRTILLHGVTGSGKTAVYVEAARNELSRGKSVIVLVPEIALTSQIVDEFSSHFPNIYLTHSGQTEAQRHLVWKKVANDPKPKIIIGPRSALFLPVYDVGLIIIDEAHEPSYKQEQSPRYSALRAASILARNHKARLVLGSATPSLPDYFIAQQKGTIVSMPVTARSAKKPTIHLIDMTDRQNFTRHRFFSNTMLTELEKTIASGHQVLFFHNRRGSASVVLCEQCGWQSICSRCYVPLSLHADEFKTRCHICGFAAKVPLSCPECDSSSIVYKGIGTKIIESELAKLYPKAHIARFDGDSDQENTINARYKELYDGSIQIIIGTQVVAKGLDLPGLRMVGIVQADTGLFLPDFSAPERTFQLLAQAVGRVGRDEHDTSVVVQSFHPNHFSITEGLAANYQEFYEKELLERKRANFPPFSFLLRLTCVYKSEYSAIKNASELAKQLRKVLPDSVEILGPAPAFYERMRDTYRWQLILKSRQRKHLIDALHHLPPAHWQFELDPISLL